MNYIEIIEKLKDKPIGLWDYITALRGPDNGDCKLKALTTCVLRGDDPQSGYDGLNSTKRVLLDNDVESLIEVMKTAQLHFIAHFKYALNALIEHDILPSYLECNYDIPKYIKNLKKYINEKS